MASLVIVVIFSGIFFNYISIIRYNMLLLHRILIQYCMIVHCYMAKPVLGKSLCSDWFFLGQDFAVRTVSMETVQPVYFCF